LDFIRGYLIINSKNNFVRNNTLGRGINTHPLVINDIDSSNTVNGKPIYYFVNKTGLTVPSDAAEIILINCSFFEITNLNLSENAPGIILGLSDNNLIHNNIINNGNHGIRLLQSCNNTISKNYIQDNIVAIAILSESNHNIINVNRLKGVYTKPNFIGRGIEIVYSNNNLVYNNIIQGFFEYGIWLYADSINNSFHHNNLIQNRINARDECSNIWDNGYPSGGNYWSDFHNESQGAYDNNSDGIVDSPYSIPGGENQDRYPLIYPFEDTNPPTIDILKPTNAVYFRNKEIVPFFLPLIIGDIQICFLAGDNESGLDYTELFINNELKVTFTSVPKSWLWNEITLFKIRHTIRLIAYDNAGNNAIIELIVIRFL